MNIQDLFDCIIAREDVSNLKPNSEAYLLALNKMNVKSDNCIVVEDSKRGIDSAINANLHVIKVDEYTSIKFHDNRCFEYRSINTLFELLINYSEAKEKQ